MSGPEVLVPVVLFAGGFAMVFGIVYLKTRQNMAMIEKGMNPKEFANRPAPYKNLKWALLLIGAGAGLLVAYMLDVYVLQHAKSANHDRRPNDIAEYAAKKCSLSFRQRGDGRSQARQAHARDQAHYDNAERSPNQHAP